MSFKEKFDKKIKDDKKSKYIKQKDFENIMDESEIEEKDYDDLIEKVIKEEIQVLEVEEEILEEDEIEEVLEEVEEKYYHQDILKQYFNEIGKYDVLSPEKEVELVRKAKAGDREAEEMVITSNLRLVASIAMKYAKSGVYYLDLVQDGTIGLIKALKKFDVEKGYKLSTYATWWIKKEIIDSLKDKINVIKIPNYIFLTYQKIQVAEKKLTQIKGRKVSLEEISIELKMEIKEVEKIKKAVGNRVVDISNDNDSNDKSEYEIKDNRTVEEIDEEIENLSRKMKISNILKTLTKRERQIIEMYFGLSNFEKKSTFKEIGEVMEISAERVRVLKERSLRKLRYAGMKLGDDK